MNIYCRNYQKLMQLIPTLPDMKTASKLTAPGFMNLNVDVLSRHRKKIVVALSHYYYKHPSGDMIADPDMTIAVYTQTQSVEVLAYQGLLWVSDGVQRRWDVILTIRKEGTEFIPRSVAHQSSRTGAHADEVASVRGPNHFSSIFALMS